MKITAISYATGDYYLKCQARLNIQLQAQNIDEIMSYGPEDIDSDFHSKHSDVLDCPKLVKRLGRIVPVASGYCVWKPYLIRKTLQQMSNDDIVLYMDVEDIITGSPRLANYLMDKTLLNKGVSSIITPNLNKCWTKRDTFILMDCDTSNYHNSLQHEAGFIGIRKNEFTMQFMDEWIDYCSVPRIIDGSPSTLGDDFPDFVEHRYDQSIYSLLLHKKGITGDMLHAGPQSYGLTHMLNIPLVEG